MPQMRSQCHLRDQGIIEYFRAKRWNTTIEGAGSHFRCTGKRGDQGCGHKGAFNGIAPAKEGPNPEPPEPIESNQRRD
jgi:hypothetical protein